MITKDRNRINELKANRAVLMQRTLSLRGRQISLERERAELALAIAHNDVLQNEMDQEIATIIAADYTSRVHQEGQ